DAAADRLNGDAGPTYADVRTLQPRPSPRRGERSAGRPGHDLARVAVGVAEARIGAGLAARDRRVDAEGVGRILEGNPPVGREVDLDPCVRVLSAHDVAFRLRVEGAGSVSVYQPSRDAQGAKHVAHGRGEELAIADVAVEEEPVDRINSWRWHRGEGVLEVALVAQVALDGGGHVVGSRRAGRLDDLLGLVVDRGQDVR